jgi:hypothetical protein
VVHLETCTNPSPSDFDNLLKVAAKWIDTLRCPRGWGMNREVGKITEKAEWCAENVLNGDEELYVVLTRFVAGVYYLWTLYRTQNLCYTKSQNTKYT